MVELVENDNIVSTSTCENGDYSGISGYGDPHYKMFLENVKQDGKSYALAVHQENHLPEVLRYETQHQHLVGGERGAENLEAMESSPVSSSIKGGRLSNGENTEIADSLASFSREGGVWSPRTLRYYAREKGKREILRTSDALPSKRRRIRSAGGESSIRSGLEDNCLIGHEICHEGDVEDVPSERRKSFLVRRRAGKELKGPKSGGTSLRSCSKSKQFGEKDFYHDNDDDDDDDWGFDLKGNFLGQSLSEHEDDPDEEQARILNSGSRGACGGSYARLGSQGNFLDHPVSDHENDTDEEYILNLNSGPRGTSGDPYARIDSEGNFLDQLQSDHEDEICDKDENDLPYLHSIKRQTHHRDEIGDSDEYYGLVNCACGGMNWQSNTRPRSEGSHSINCACDQEDLYDDIDKEYVAFVNQLQLEGEDTAYEIDGDLRRFDQEDHSDDLDEEYVAFVNQLEMNGEDTIYKVDDSPWRRNKVESESDIEIMDEDPYGGGASTPFVSSNQCEQIDMGEIDVDNYSFAEDPAINCSMFKKGLMEVLKMPYDSKEHEALKHSVSYRSPIIQERDCGSTKKSHRLEHKLGKSYLDLHTDFRKQLDEAKNDEIKSLNLLRGFVYWLTHISYDMGFKPWLDPSCLEVLPQKLAGRTQHALKSECK